MGTASVPAQLRQQAIGVGVGADHDGVGVDRPPSGHDPEAGTPTPTPVDLSETPGRFRHRAPTLGEHTDAILGELGYSPAAISDLRGRGVI